MGLITPKRRTLHCISFQCSGIKNCYVVKGASFHATCQQLVSLALIYMQPTIMVKSVGVLDSMLCRIPLHTILAGLSYAAKTGKRF